MGGGAQPHVLDRFTIGIRPVGAAVYRPHDLVRDRPADRETRVSGAKPLARGVMGGDQLVANPLVGQRQACAEPVVERNLTGDDARHDRDHVGFVDRDDPIDPRLDDRRDPVDVPGEQRHGVRPQPSATEGEPGGVREVVQGEDRLDPALARP